MHTFYVHTTMTLIYTSTEMGLVCTTMDLNVGVYQSLAAKTDEFMRKT